MQDKVYRWQKQLVILLAMAISGVLASYIWHVFECMQNPPIIKCCSLLTFCFYHHLLFPLPSAVSASLLALSVRERLQNNAEFIWSCFLRNVYQVYQMLLSTVSSFLWEWHLGKHFLLWLLLVELAIKGQSHYVMMSLLVLTAEVCSGEARKSGDFRIIRECP